MIGRGGINNIIRLIHTIVNEKLLHHSRGHGGSGAPPIPPEIMKKHPLDPDAGPHTGALTEDDVTFDDSAGHDHQGAAATGQKIDHTKVDNVTPDQHHPESHAPDHKDGGAQALDVKELVDSEGRLLTGVQKTDLTDGGLTVLHGHGGETTAAVQIILTNETGGERTAGDVVVTDPDHDESFIGTSGSPGYQGKVLVVAETIASSGSGRCWERGGPFNINVVGAVDRNDGLRTSATIYKAEAAPSVVSDGVFAIALSTSGSGGGTIKAVFLDVVSEGGDGVGTIEVQEDDAKVADADIVNFEGGGGKVTDEGGGKVTVDITPAAGAPADASYVTTEAEAGLSAEKVLGTDIIMQGLAAAKPAAGIAGRIYIETDGSFIVWRDDGAAWNEIARGETGIRLAQLAEKTAASVVNVPAGGIAATNVQSAINELDTEKATTSHKDTHKFGGGDPFAPADLLDGIVRRLRETGGPADLLIGAVADGEFLKRDGAAIVGDTPVGGEGEGGHVHAYKENKSAECDGVKVTFITAQQFEPYTLRVFHERLEQVDGMVDYAEGAMHDHFDMVAAPNPGDKLVVHYLAQRV